jgi:hypothetical protein
MQRRPLWYRAAGVIGRMADRMAPAREKSSSERRAHLAALEKIVSRWQSGELSTAEKREQIAQENTFWYGRQHKSPATGEVVTSAGGDYSHVTPEPPRPPDDDDRETPWWQK